MCIGLVQTSNDLYMWDAQIYNSEVVRLNLREEGKSMHEESSMGQDQTKNIDLNRRRCVFQRHTDQWFAREPSTRIFQQFLNA
jgi:hypothetical protein